MCFGDLDYKRSIDILAELEEFEKSTCLEESRNILVP